MFLLLLALLATPAHEIVVRPAGPVATLAAAVALAHPGDTITVQAGTYPTGNVTIPLRGLVLRGEGWPVLDGEGQHGILVITADDVTVTGFVLRGAGVSMTTDQAAVRVVETGGCRILGNRLEGDFFGVYLQRAHGCRIAGNVIHGSGGDEAVNGNGIHLWNATDV
ncbi:MAG: nitrous oxide reductase family maturation protein NosD, partial [Gemmatimonadetes bacterium]|nr:nitrous oxide reductase family maturation protein NosD [Gemmatimonadota bacterium]